MLTGECHCGNVRFEYDDVPEFALRCNCSVCRKLGAVWIYSEASNISIGSGKTLAYSHSDENLAFHSCARCGATTHWVNSRDVSGKMAVNFNLIEPAATQGIAVRNFDGADSWTFLD